MIERAQDEDGIQQEEETSLLLHRSEDEQPDHKRKMKSEKSVLTVRPKLKWVSANLKSKTRAPLPPPSQATGLNSFLPNLVTPPVLPCKMRIRADHHEDEEFED